MIPVTRLLDENQLYHSELQMDRFITLRAGGTVYGCYKQALRELHTRHTALAGHYAARALLIVDIDELEATQSNDEFQARRDAIGLAQKRLSLEELNRNIADTEREYLHFYGQAVALRRALGLSDDEPMSPERRRQLDEEMWEHQLRCTAAVDFVSHGRPRSSVIEFIQALPPDMRKPIADAVLTAGSADRLVDWFLTYAPELPEPALPTPDHARRLLECCESSVSPKRLPNSSPTAVPRSAASSTKNDCESARTAQTGEGTIARCAGVSCS